MNESGVPPKFPIPWANTAVSPYVRPIPEASQIGIQAGAASLTDGFPPVTFEPEGSGGTPPYGSDMNGILKQVTAWLQWVQAGGPIQYDGTFQTSIGGYPLNCQVFSATTAGKIWMSTADANTSNPDTGGANWVQVGPSRPAGGDLTGTYPNPTVALNAVDNTKLAQMVAGTVKGNITGLTANPADVPISSLLTALGFTASFSPNGYVKFPFAGDTLIIQWGINTTYHVGEANTLVTFPIPFPAACFMAVATAITSGSGGNDIWAQVFSFATTNFRVYTQSSATGADDNTYGFTWIAIGH